MKETFSEQSSKGVEGTEKRGDSEEENRDD
jgi:hypothetical protein